MGNNGGMGGQQRTGEKKDWLDKGISSMADKVGVHVSDKNADTIGDKANQMLNRKEGFKLPGVR